MGNAAKGAAALQRFVRSERGSYTLESALIYPTILLALVSIVFMSLFLYEKSVLYYTASMTAERAAYSWDNTRKDWTTGNVAPGQYDGLYWRTGSDGIGGMFAFGSALGLQKVLLPADGSSGGQGPKAKLTRAAEGLPADVTGELTYRHGLIDREVTARLGRRGLLPFLASQWDSSYMQAQVKSIVTEPVELIRNVDFVRTFVVRVKDLITVSKAGETVPREPPPEQKKLVFARAEEAAVYVRGITGGVKKWVSAPSGDRQLDSLDADGLMHEVKLGYTSKAKDIQSQVDKDLELMRQSSEVKGVVWHFFRKEKDGKIGPSKPLRDYLEQRGIIVVIHQ
ncbi:TadE/TadG family type IV pilus assembly protein [Paenibacillus hodogayensis]|uniref:TadE/TadG family type IV pilus assembly protein n=1 Tax=Paenibacillus hodogayensis TaxID=279208 RepID=A0ABV5W439_9BACL